MSGDVIYDSEKQIHTLSSRFVIIYFFLGLLFLILIVRLWHLQIIQGEQLRNVSVKNRVKQKKVLAPRGYILDREGRVLVDNTMVLQLTLNLQNLSEEERTTIAEKVGPILNMTSTGVREQIRKSVVKNGPFFPAVIADNLTFDQTLALKLLRFDHPSLNVEEFIFRSYPFGNSGAQLFGYISQVSRSQLNNADVAGKQLSPGDMIGKKGLEKIWDNEIRGKDGLTYVQVDAHGRVTDIEETVLEGSNLAPIPPQSGHHLQLTIDQDIQEIAHRAFQREDHIGQRIGALVAINKEGEILAWVSEPSYDSNQFLYGISNRDWNELIMHPFKPLRNKVIQDHFSPGSTFKPFVALAALEEEVIKPETLIDSPGYFVLGRRRYHNHNRHGHGLVNIATAMETSSNVFFYKLAVSLDIDIMGKFARAFGLGSRTNIGLDHETQGLVPSRAWKLKNRGEEWQKGEDLSHAIGQGSLDVTPLQMVLSYLAIGNGGKLYKPLLVKKVLAGRSANQSIQEFKPELVYDLTQKDNPSGVTIKKESFDAVKHSMWRVNNGERGSGRWWKIPHVEMAGKTGTSQVRSFRADDIYSKCEDRKIEDRHHGWYVGYAPADKPEIAVAVMTMHSCHGSTGSAPLARDVMEGYMRKYHPDLFISDKQKIGMQ